MLSLSFLLIAHLYFYVGPVQATEQEERSFQIQVDGQDINVICLDSTGNEAFKIAIRKNGGIDEITVQYLPFINSGGWFVWRDDWNQIGADVMSEPIIQNMGDYIIVTCFGRYLVHPFKLVTNITICKTGIIFIHSTLTAENATATENIAWGFWGLPEDAWKDSKVYAYIDGKPVQEIVLPASHPVGQYSIWSGSDTLWMDLSKQLSGITIISLAPQYFSAGEICDERDYSPVFSCRFTLAGGNAFGKGEARIANVAMYIHGPGGYENALSIINMLVTLGKAWGTAIKGLESYKDTEAKELASQTLSMVDSAYNKILKGDFSDAQSDLSQASSLIKRAADTERNAELFRDLTMAAIPIIAVIALVIVLKKRKKETVHTPSLVSH